MRSLRAELRRAARAEARRRYVPAVPGAMADRTEVSVELALAEAHLVLPPLSGTEVSVVLFEPEEGLALIEAKMGADSAAAVRARLEALPADAAEPTVLIASRRYRDAELRRPATTHHHEHHEPKDPNV